MYEPGSQVELAGLYRALENLDLNEGDTIGEDATCDGSAAGHPRPPSRPNVNCAKAFPLWSSSPWPIDDISPVETLARQGLSST